MRRKKRTVLQNDIKLNNKKAKIQFSDKQMREEQ